MLNLFFTGTEKVFQAHFHRVRRQRRDRAVSCFCDHLRVCCEQQFWKNSGQKLMIMATSRHTRVNAEFTPSTCMLALLCRYYDLHLHDDTWYDLFLIPSVCMAAIPGRDSIKKYVCHHGIGMSRVTFISSTDRPTNTHSSYACAYLPCLAIQVSHGLLEKAFACHDFLYVLAWHADAYKYIHMCVTHAPHMHA